MPEVRATAEGSEIQCDRCGQWYPGRMFAMMDPPDVRPAILKPGEKPTGKLQVKLLSYCAGCMVQSVAGMLASLPFAPKSDPVN